MNAIYGFIPNVAPKPGASDDYEVGADNSVD
jgi:hypothetical protein